MKITRIYLLLFFLFSYGITMAQGIMVSGTVYDSNTSATLPGVNVVEKGTTNGTITDVKGSFNLKVADENASLVFSFIGFVKQEVKVGTNKMLKIQLKQEVSDLDEVVVVGYGTQK
jgi:hypothetical protein